MLHLSTKEMVLSIEKAELEINHGIIYQKYPNFFGPKEGRIFWPLGDQEEVRISSILTSLFHFTNTKIF